MQAISNFDELKNNVSTFRQPKAGGYICKITAVKDVPATTRLEMNFDIADGEFAGYAQELFNDKGFWALSGISSYSQKAQYFFAKFIKAVEESNPGYHWDFNENSLVGKKIGVVFFEKEYINKKGKVSTSLKVSEYLPVEDIANGKFDVPPRMTVSKPEQTFTPVAVEDDDLPF